MLSLFLSLSLLALATTPQNRSFTMAETLGEKDLLSTCAVCVTSTHRFHSIIGDYLEPMGTPGGARPPEEAVRAREHAICATAGQSGRCPRRPRRGIHPLCSCLDGNAGQTVERKKWQLMG